MEKILNKKQLEEKAPFREWRKSDLLGCNADFFHLSEFPGMEIRRCKEFFEVTNEEGELIDMDQKTAIEYWTKRAKEFKSFAEKYGLKVADTSYFIVSAGVG